MSFPTTVDSTMMRVAKSCPRKFYNEFLLSRVAKGLSPDLNAGKAWAKAHEVFRTSYYSGALGFEDSLVHAYIALTEEFGDEEYDPPKDNPKQYERLLEALIAYYYEEYPPTFDDHQPLLIDGKPAVEFSFAEPIEEVLHPETGEPILYAGTFDMLSQKSGALNYIFDDKTTKQMGPKWSSLWRLRSQFIGYVWGARKWGYKTQGAWVRGCAIKKNSIEFADAPVNIPQYLVEEWYENLVHELRYLISLWEQGHFPKNLDEACSQYGGCQYQEICELPDSQASIFLNDDASFEDRNWNPVSVEHL